MGNIWSNDAKRVTVDGVLIPSLRGAAQLRGKLNARFAVGQGYAFKGVVSLTGSATVGDVRTTGASDPWCALMNTGVDTYDVVGSKA